MAEHDASPLDRLSVASPCTASWSEMTGDDRVRFCGRCQRHVYNLSEMTRGEAEALIRRREGRLCARFYRRADGTVLTGDCPIGLRALRKRVSKLAGRFAGALAFLLGATGLLRADNMHRLSGLRALQPFAALCDWLSPATPVALPAIMGDIALPLPVLQAPGQSRS